MENKVSIILSSDVWMHITEVLLVAEDLTRNQTPALASQLHAIATSILGCTGLDIDCCFIKSQEELDK